MVATLLSEYPESSNMKSLSQPSAWRGFLHLMSAHWMSLRNAPRTRDGSSRLRLIFFGGLALLFMWGMGWGANWLFTQFLQAEFLADLLIRRVLDITLIFFVGLLVFSNIIGGFSVFFFAEDMQQLVASPVPPGRLYIARLTQTWAQSSWMVLVFAIPVFWALGPVFDSPWWFYPGVPLAVLPLTIACAAFGTCVTIGLARWLPARRTRDALIILAIVGFLVLYIAFRLAEPERFLEPDGFEDLVSLIAGLQSSESVFAPTTWTLNIIVGLARDELAAVPLAVISLVSGTISACAVGVWLSRGVLFDCFSMAQEGRPARSRDDSPRQVSGVGYIEDPIKAIARRDTRIFLRTTGQWTQLLLVAALVVVYLFNFKHFRALQETKMIGTLGIFYINFALSGLVVTTLGARFLYPSVSLEGRAFWAVQVAPIFGKTVLAGKVRWGLIPMTIVATLLAVGSGLITQLEPWMILTSMVLALLSTISLSGLAVGMGAMWPQFHLDNPTRIASGLGGVLFMLIGLSYLVVTGVLSAWPIVALRDFLGSGYVPRTVRLIQIGACALGFIGLSLLTFWLPMWLGARRLDEGQ
jgi:ABC-2 type transport system permease protein